MSKSSITEMSLICRLRQLRDVVVRAEQALLLAAEEDEPHLVARA